MFGPAKREVNQVEHACIHAFTHIIYNHDRLIPEEFETLDHDQSFITDPALIEIDGSDYRLPLGGKNNHGMLYTV